MKKMLISIKNGLKMVYMRSNSFNLFNPKIQSHIFSKIYFLVYSRFKLILKLLNKNIKDFLQQNYIKLYSFNINNSQLNILRYFLASLNFLANFG